MIFYPDIYLKNVKEITVELLNKNNIKGLLLDVDNTLIDFDLKILEGAKEWAEDLKNNNIKLCILSNTNKIDKVKKVAKELDIPYLNFAKKPAKSGFRKGAKLLELEPKNIATVGDQIMTDVWGGNRMGMYTILTIPLGEKDILITRVKRPLEKLIIKHYLKKVGEKNVF